MKYPIYLFTVLIVALGADVALAANFPASSEIMAVASNSVELDVTMEMLDEDATSSSDIIHVIELPVQEMRQEQIRNERRFRQEDAASPLRQEHGSPGSDQGELTNQIIDIQQEAEEAKRNVYDDTGQQKRR